MAAEEILIIEDEVRLRRNLAALLRRAGYTVTTAATGKEGLEYVQRARFDVVITDLVMEAFAKFELLESLVAFIPDTPIIVITGNTSTLSAAEAFSRGAHDYIPKPFAVDVLKESIARAIESSRDGLPRLHRQAKGRSLEPPPRA